MASDGDLAILIPILRRPWRIPPVYESARAATPNARILFIASPDDQASIAVLDEFEVDYVLTTWPGGDRGDYARKINLGYETTLEPLLFTGADDLAFHADWYEHARALIDVPEIVDTILQGGGMLRGPKHVPRIGVVGTVDLCNGRTYDRARLTRLGHQPHSTHSLVARWYADQGGMVDVSHVIYNPAYWHEYCDDELVQTAQARQAYAHAWDATVEHLHYLVGKAAMDAVYEHGKERSYHSKRIFAMRRPLWST